MTIGRRFIDLAKAELNSLLDYASRRERAGDDGDDGDPVSLHGYTDKELQEELERRRREHDEEAEHRRKAREEVDEALYGRTRNPTPPKSEPRPGQGARPGSSGSGGRRPPPPSSSGPLSEMQQVQRAYAALEVPPGSDFETVRKAYRSLMRKYHPDHHTGSPQKQRAANEVAQKLTEAYKLLEKRLRHK